MSKLDLVTKKSVLDTLQKIFKKYNVGYNPDCDEIWGFGEAVPKSIEDLDIDYDVTKVLNDLSTNPSYLIPCRGRCMNVDLVKQTIEDGWINDLNSSKPDNLDEDIDIAINFIENYSFCNKCYSTMCDICGKYKAKKYALIALDFYKKIDDILIEIDEIKNLNSSQDVKKIYDEISKIIQETKNHSINSYL